MTHINLPMRRAAVHALFLRLGIGCLGATTVTLVHAQARDPANSKPLVEEVIVTARKVAESLQNVPVSVVAVTQEELAQRSISDLADLGQSTPNLTFGQQAQGGRSAGTVYIRGVGQADTLITYDPAVGVYIDGVFLGRMQGNDIDMLDIERVEVLRGPQGTLFGKNTSGGAVDIITRQPDVSASDPDGRLQLTAGDRNRLDVVGGVNLPLVADKLALQVTGSHRKQDGYGRRIDGQDTGSTDRDAAKLSLLLQASENFSALLSADGLTYDETNAAYNLRFVNPTIGPLAALNTLTTARYDSRWYSSDELFSNGTGPNSSRGDLWGSSLTLKYETDTTAFKSISAYRDNEVHNELDPDSSPVTVIDYIDTTRHHQFSQEFQASGVGLDDRLNWVLGLYYFREGAAQTNSAGLLPLLQPVFGRILGFTLANYIDNESVAGYGQGIYKLTDRLRLTAGLRYTRDDKESVRRNLVYPGGATRQPQVTKSASWDDVSPRLGLDYQWTPELMTYVSAAKGYKAGGFNGRASTTTSFNKFDPEEVLTYEVGLRSDLFERRVRFNATAFYSDYSDLQLQINGSTVENGAPVPFNIVTNIPEARVLGGEVEVTVVPLEGLTLSAGLGLTDTQYVTLPNDAQFVAANLVDKDNRFVNSPKTSATFGAQYETLVGNDFNVIGRVDYSYRSTIFYDPMNSPLVRQKPYSLVNARLTFEHEPSQISLSLFGTNLTDERYIVGGFDDATVPAPGLGFSIANMAPPREYGASVQVRF